MRKAYTLILMLALFSLHLQAQDREISGTIISSQDNLSIPGVAILVVGTTIGTATDMDGKYKIKVPNTATKLRFSALGMKTKEVTIGESSTMDITLDMEILKLEEVVVTANEIKREKRSLGYATQQVKADELTVGQNTNVIGALQGKASGVQVTSLSGAPGSSQRIVIRGGSSISRNNQALIVVDGVPIDNSNFRTDNDLDNQVDYGNRGNDINPNDIESISVLKGPGASAQYGSRASNGVIMITTKKGKRTMTPGKSKMEVTLNSSVTFSSILKMPEFQNTYGQGDLDNVDDDRRENFSWGQPFDGQLRPWGQEIDGKSRIKNYSANEDNVRDFFDQGVGYSNSLSFAGGTEKSSYYLSISSLNSKGIVPTTFYDKYNIHFNGGSELSNHFSTSVSINYSNISSKLPSGGQQNASIYDQLFQTPRDIPIVEGKDQTDPFNLYDDVHDIYTFYAAYTLNPYFILANYDNRNNVDRVFGNVNVSYSQWDWLTITNRFGGDIYSDRRTESWKKYDYAPGDETGLYSTINNRQTYQGKYSQDLYFLTSFNNDLMLNFNKQLTKNISGTLLLGQNVRQNILQNTFAQTNSEGGLALEGYYNLENSSGPPDTKNNLNKTRNVGYYADASLAYKNMLFVGLTARNDKSSTLPADNNSYFYSSANASFVFSELFSDSLRDKKWTFGKVRLSYAKVGNDAPAYRTTNYYSKTLIDGGFGSTKFPFNGSIIGYSSGDIYANSAIKPEFSTEFEIGTDLGFLNERLSVTVNYYIKTSKDQIIDLPLPPSTGYTSKTINTGEIENKGFELDVRGVPVLTKSGLKVEIYGSYWKNTSLVKSLYEGVDQLILGGTSRTAVVAQVGQPYGAFFAVDLLKDPNGNVVVDSSTGLPRTTPDLVYCGNYQPKFQATIGTEVTYKGFTLNVLFDIKNGGQFSSRTKQITEFVGTSKITEDRDDKVWPGSVYLASDGQYVTNSTPYHPYTYFTNVIPDGQDVVDASYTKLREMSIAYQLPKKLIDKTPFGSVSFALFGNNLFIWTPEANKYADPEQNSSGASNTQGFEFTSNPSQRNYGFNLKVTF